MMVLRIPRKTMGEIKKTVKKLGVDYFKDRIRSLRLNCTEFLFDDSLFSLTREEILSRVIETLETIENQEVRNECISVILDTSTPIPDIPLEPAFKVINLEPASLCQLFFQYLQESSEFIAQLKDGFYFGFREFLAVNRIAISEDLFNLLFVKIFPKYTPNSQIDLPSATEENPEKDDSLARLSIIFRQMNLDFYERDLKEFFNRIDNEHLRVLFLLHLVTSWITKILHDRKEKVGYSGPEDEILILKRILYAQQIKLSKSGSCAPENIDSVASTIQEIKTKCEDLAITVDILEDEL